MSLITSSQSPQNGGPSPSIGGGPNVVAFATWRGEVPPLRPRVFTAERLGDSGDVVQAIGQSAQMATVQTMNFAVSEIAMQAAIDRLMMLVGTVTSCVTGRNEEIPRVLLVDARIMRVKRTARGAAAPNASGNLTKVEYVADFELNLKRQPII